VKPEARDDGDKNRDAFVQYLCRCIIAELKRRGLLPDTRYHDNRYAQPDHVPEEGSR
jgi:hypothetical protein